MATSPPEDLPPSQPMEGFFANILTPGSSLNPIFLYIVDAVLASLMLIFLALLILYNVDSWFQYVLLDAVSAPLCQIICSKT